MQKFTAHDAKAQFGSLIDTAFPEPVTIERHGRHERPQIDVGIFSYPHQSHVIVFRRCRIGIEILRILHRRMDPARHLENGEPE